MKSTEHEDKREAPDALEELLRHAPARPRPPRDTEQAVRAALHSEWQALTTGRKRRRLALSLAAAATVLLAVMVSGTLLRERGAVALPQTLASVEMAVGAALLEAPGTAGLRLSTAAELQTGQGIVTQAAARLALRWRDGSSVRLDEYTRVELTPAGEIRLLRGRVYVDTAGADTAAEPVAILTPAGRLRHLGTQYMAVVAAAGTTVSVREGRVRLERPTGEARADAGEQLWVDAAGSSSRQAIPRYGDLWQWTQEVAPAFASDGRSVADFLDWVSRESGHSIRYASPEAQQLALQTELRGQLAMEPMRALAVILQTSDLTYEVEDGTLLIRPGGSR